MHKTPPAFVARLHWPRIATRNLEVIGPDDRVFDDFFFPPPENEPARCLMVPALPRLQTRYGTYATIANYRGRANYYHWMVNCLTRLWLLEEAHLDDFQLLVPAEQLHFHKETLRLLRFSADRVVPFGDEHWLVERLLVPSYAMAPGHAPREGCRWLARRLLSSVGPAARQVRRLYISRADAPRRRLVNEPQITELLSRHGFTTVRCEAMSVRQQAALFRSADVVVAPHGAGLTNMLFMREGGLVVELAPSRRAKPHFCNLASAMGLRYACVTDAPDEAQDESPPGPWPDADFSVPLQRVAAALAKLDL